MSMSPSEIFSVLNAGINVLDLQESVVFQKYVRVILPADGYVFWSPEGPALPIQGALHYTQSIVQNEEETYAMAAATFTAQSIVTDFEAAPTNAIFVASTKGGTRYAFSQQNGYFSTASQWHYFGHSIPPAMLTQLLDTPGVIDLMRPVTSNSMALWLALNGYQTPFADWFTNTIDIYPAKLVPANLQAPYIAVDIYDTRPLQMIPSLRQSRSSHQLVADRCRLVLYGLQSDEAIDFLNCLIQYSEYTENFGLMSIGTISDAHKRESTEIQAIAMRKSLDVEVSYFQARVESVTRQLIKQATPVTFILPPPVSSNAMPLESQAGYTLTTQSGQTLETQ